MTKSLTPLCHSIFDLKNASFKLLIQTNKSNQLILQKGHVRPRCPTTQVEIPQINHRKSKKTIHSTKNKPKIAKGNKTP
jgi:hypothetical protein